MTGPVTRDEHVVLNEEPINQTSTSETPNGTQQQEEDVLRDVLNELDRERTRRAELEAQIRKMTDDHEALISSLQAANIQLKEQEELIVQLKTEVTAPPPAQKVGTPPAPAPQQQETEEAVTQRAFMAMEVQVKEYQALVDELTKGKPAIAAAAKLQAKQQRHNANNGKFGQKRNTTLPLYVVRLLEILPWTPHAHEHVFSQEEIFEWQYFDNREQQWVSTLRGFPQYFKSLPIVRPKRSNNKDSGDHASNDKDRGLLLFLAGGAGKANPAAPSKHGVLTDEPMTCVLSIEDGYPLPEDGGTWEWIGGWRVEKRVTQSPASSSASSSLKQKVDCDEDGWSYSQEAEYFKINPTEWVWDNPGEELIVDNKKDFQRKLRRRKWTRQRVLVDYPYACEQTKQYLKLLAENARLTVTTNKISDQLVETKFALTSNEEMLMQEKSEATAELAKLTEELQMKNSMLREMGADITETRPRAGSTGSNPIQEFMSKNEQMKGISNKISQWVKAGRQNGGEENGSSTPTNASAGVTEDNTPVSNNSSGASSGTSPKIGGFDWKKGRDAFLDKLKGSDKSSKSRSSSPILEKLGESGQRNSSEGSMTDESVEDAMEEQTIAEI